MNGSELISDDFSKIQAMLNEQAVSLIINEVDDASAITGINHLQSVSVSVNPNPASTLLNVFVTENATVQLWDIVGKEMFIETNVNGNVNGTINIEGLSNGVYIMKVISNSGATKSVKVVVEK